MSNVSQGNKWIYSLAPSLVMLNKISSLFLILGKYIFFAKIFDIQLSKFIWSYTWHIASNMIL